MSSPTAESAADNDNQNSSSRSTSNNVSATQALQQQQQQTEQESAAAAESATEQDETSPTLLPFRRIQPHHVLLEGASTRIPRKAATRATQVLYQVKRHARQTYVGKKKQVWLPLAMANLEKELNQLDEQLAKESGSPPTNNPHNNNSNSCLEPPEHRFLIKADTSSATSTPLYGFEGDTEPSYAVAQMPSTLKSFLLGSQSQPVASTSSSTDGNNDQPPSPPSKAADSPPSSTAPPPRVFQTNVLLSPPIVTLTAYIPSAAVGAVIGRRGQKVEDLQRKAAAVATTKHPVRVSVVGHDQLSTFSTSNSSTGDLSSSPPSLHGMNATGAAAVSGGDARTTMPGASTLPVAPAANPATSSLYYTYSGLDFSDPAWTPVVIRGDIEAALEACRGLTEACSLDEVVLDLPMPHHRHAAIIGKQGLTLAKLSADYAVRIMVPHKQSGHDVIQLEGDLKNVQSCLVVLLAIASRLMKREDSNASSGGGSPYHPVTDSLTVATQPPQSRIRNLVRRTGCTIKKKKVDNQWQIIVTGKASKVTTAMQALRKWPEADATSTSTTTGDDVDEGPTAAAGGGGGAVGRGGKKTRPRTRSRKASTKARTVASADQAEAIKKQAIYRRIHEKKQSATSSDSK